MAHRGGGSLRRDFHKQVIRRRLRGEKQAERYSGGYRSERLGEDMLFQKTEVDIREDYVAETVDPEEAPAGGQVAQAPDASTPTRASCAEPARTCARELHLHARPGDRPGGGGRVRRGRGRAGVRHLRGG